MKPLTRQSKSSGVPNDENESDHSSAKGRQEMSADSWRRCTVCQNRPSEYPEGIAHLYGKIPQDEFLELSKKLEDLKDTETVRMDYELSIEDDGRMSIWASGVCSNCGAEWAHPMEYIQYKPGVSEDD